MAKTLTAEKPAAPPPPDPDLADFMEHPTPADDTTSIFPASNEAAKMNQPPAEAPQFDYELLDTSLASERRAPYDGSAVMVSDDETKPGVAARWKTSRRRVGFSWVPYAVWVDVLTGAPVPFEPVVWRPNANFSPFI